MSKELIVLLLEHRYPSMTTEIRETEQGDLVVLLNEGGEVHLAFPLAEASNVMFAITQLADAPTPVLENFLDHINKNRATLTSLQLLTGLLIIDELAVREQVTLN